ncbi:hypothetical protein NKH77_12175 [Streptomyces sp. M19]
MVICAYTADRWDDVLAAVASVGAQSRPAHETLVVVDHNASLRERLADHFGGAPPGGAGSARPRCSPTRARAACRRAATPASPRPPAR